MINKTVSPVSARVFHARPIGDAVFSAKLEQFATEANDLKLGTLGEARARTAISER